MAGQGGVTIESLRTAVAQRELAPVYLVIGAEAALRRRAFETLRGAFLEADGSEVPGSIRRLDIKERESEVAPILDECRSLPLFAMASDGPLQLVWVSSAENLTRIEDEGQLADLQRYIESPVSSTCLVFEAAHLDKRRSISRALLAAAVVVDCATPENEGDVRRWIEGTVRGQGYMIDADAVVLLLNMAGTSITVLEHEVEKAMLQAGAPGSTIRAADLEGLLGRSRERSVFELTDALVAGNAPGATRVLNQLIDDGEDPIPLLGMISWITRQLVIGSDVGGRLPAREAMAALAGQWEGRRRILERCRSSSREALLEALRACARSDEQIKRLRDSRLGADRLRPSRGILESLCRQICAA